MAEERITNAVLATRIDNLTDEVRRMRDEVRTWRNDHEERLREAEHQITVHGQRLNVATGGLMVFQAIAAVIAGWFGASR